MANTESSDPTLKHGDASLTRSHRWCAECTKWIANDFDHWHFRNLVSPHPGLDFNPTIVNAKQVSIKYKTPLLNEREKTHGNFDRAAIFIQSLKDMMRLARAGRNNFEADQCEALDQIATKLGRICYGNIDCIEHWADIAGYANLIKERLEREQSKSERIP